MKKTGISTNTTNKTKKKLKLPPIISQNNTAAGLSMYFTPQRTMSNSFLMGRNQNKLLIDSTVQHEFKVHLNTLKIIQHTFQEQQYKLVINVQNNEKSKSKMNFETVFTMKTKDLRMKNTGLQKVNEYKYIVIKSNQVENQNYLLKFELIVKEKNRTSYAVVAEGYYQMGNHRQLRSFEKQKNQSIHMYLKDKFKEQYNFNCQLMIDIMNISNLSKTERVFDTFDISQSMILKSNNQQQLTNCNNSIVNSSRYKTSQNQKSTPNLYSTQQPETTKFEEKKEKQKQSNQKQKQKDDGNNTVSIQDFDEKNKKLQEQREKQRQKVEYDKIRIQCQKIENIDESKGQLIVEMYVLGKNGIVQDRHNKVCRFIMDEIDDSNVNDNTLNTNIEHIFDINQEFLQKKEGENYKDLCIIFVFSIEMRQGQEEISYGWFGINLFDEQNDYSLAKGNYKSNIFNADPDNQPQIPLILEKYRKSQSMINFSISSTKNDKVENLQFIDLSTENYDKEIVIISKYEIQQQQELQKKLEQEKLEQERQEKLEQEKLEQKKQRKLEQEKQELEKQKKQEQEKIEQEKQKKIEEEKQEQEKQRKLEEDKQKKIEEENQKKLKEERKKKLKEEKQKKLEEEKQRKLEEEKQRKIEEEKQRKLEEEKQRKLEEEKQRKLLQEQQQQQQQEQSDDIYDIRKMVPGVGGMEIKMYELQNFDESKGDLGIDACLLGKKGIIRDRNKKAISISNDHLFDSDQGDNIVEIYQKNEIAINFADLKKQHPNSYKMYRILFIFSIQTKDSDEEDEYGWFVHYLFDQETGEPVTGKYSALIYNLPVQSTPQLTAVSQMESKFVYKIQYLHQLKE